MKHNEISTFETFRYLNNFYYLIPLISVAIINKLKTYNSWVICSPIIVIAIYSLINTFELRKGYAEMEYEDRLKIPITVCANLEKEENFVLITEDILIYQILSINSFSICDIHDFNNCKNYLLNRNMFVLIRNDTYKYLLERYNVSLKVELSKPIFEYEDTKLYRVESFN
ncbi:hypothetical protein AGMMS49574_00780 [Bacteroidia bacterium]|nr:hypothetical protein AGMMS49574_00780 [Bacteroidia bacterium]